MTNPHRKALLAALKLSDLIVVTAVFVAVVAMTTPEDGGWINVLNMRIKVRNVFFLLGYLGSRVLGQYDIALLSAEHEPGRLLFVEENIRTTARSIGARLEDFRIWVCLHETTHAFEMEAHPWVRPYLRERLERQLVLFAEETRRLQERGLRHLTRRWRAVAAEGSLLDAGSQPVLAEAMQPYLDYRWQPQVMATDGRRKLIRSGRFELYDVVVDPGERRDLSATTEPPRELARAIADYPLPSAASAAAGGPVDDEQRRRLASLGYLSSEAPPESVLEGAPRAAD